MISFFCDMTNKKIYQDVSDACLSFTLHSFPSTMFASSNFNSFNTFKSSFLFLKT